MESSIKPWIYGIGFVVILALVIILSPFTVIGAGQRGVVLTWGAVSGTMESGIHWRTPIAQSVVKMSVQTQKLEIEDSEAYSHDLQVVKIHSALNYNLDPQSVGEVYKNIGENYEDKVIRPNLEAAVKQTIAKYSAEEILGERAKVQSDIEDAVKNAVSSSHVIVTKYALVNESFSDSYEQAIEAKQVAEQNALKADNDLKRIQIEAEQRIAQAKAEAEAIKIQAEAITQQGGAEYVNLQAVNKWNGVLPTYVLGGATPFINLSK